jgi:hypothetical protein
MSDSQLGLLRRVALIMKWEEGIHGRL